MSAGLDGNCVSIEDALLRLCCVLLVNRSQHGPGIFYRMHHTFSELKQCDPFAVFWLWVERKRVVGWNRPGPCGAHASTALQTRPDPHLVGLGGRQVLPRLERCLVMQRACQMGALAGFASAGT